MMKNLIRPIFVVVCVLLLVSVSTGRPVRANDSSDAEFIKFLEEAWVNAIVQKNVDVLNRVMGDDFSGVSPNGQRYTKQEAVADVRSGFYAVEKMELENVGVRIFGDMALVTYYQNEESKFGEKDCAGRYTFTDVWAKRDDAWQAIASHGTLVTLP
jgi:ketosteroid isomerase-like protein